MKLFIPLLFFTLFLCNCQKAKSFIDNDKKLEYDFFQIELYKRGLSIEEICENETKRAKYDIDNGNLVFFFSYSLGISYRYEKELFELLSNNGIDTSSYISSCIRFREMEKYERCYPKLMQQAIINKYGKTFTDSLSKIADSLYILKNKDTTFSYLELLDARDLFDSYVNNNKYKDLRAEFAKFFKYPKDYIFKNETSYSYTTADFILLKNGNIESLSVASRFQNCDNNKHRKHFEEALREYVKTVHWAPIENYGVKLNVSQHFTVWHK